MQTNLRKLLTAIFMVLVVFAVGSDAFAKGKRKGKGGGGSPGNPALKAAAEADIAKMKAALQYVRDRLAAAGGAEADAASRIKAVLSSLEGAKSSLRNARLTLEEIERKILSGLPADSDFKKAEKAYHAAKQKLSEEQKRVLTSPEYEAKKKEAKSAADKAEELVNVRKYALDNDSDYQAALRDYKEAKTTYENIKQELLKQDPDWASASKSLLDATAEEGMLEAKLQAGLVSDSAAKDALRSFQQAGLKAQARLASDEAASKSADPKKGKKKGKKK